MVCINYKRIKNIYIKDCIAELVVLLFLLGLLQHTNININKKGDRNYDFEC